MPIADVPGLRLHQASDVTAVWHAAGLEHGLADPPLPFWAFAWSGGLAIARYLLDHPDIVEGRRVLDVATGSGLCAIVAAKLGATDVHGVDIDPLAAAAVAINTRANRVRVTFTGRDLLDDDPPDVDVILAGDVSYEEPMARRMVAWLRRAVADGIPVLLGDPGRRYLPDGLELLAAYQVRTSREIENADVKEASVYRLNAADPRDEEAKRRQNQPVISRH
jgi:predicted nicotinamide N-methyase